MALLTATNLTRTFQAGNQTVHAVRAVNLTVHAGELVALVGPSGSGKSTLLCMLGGLDRPTSGSVALDGLELQALPETALTILRRRKIGYIFQSFNLIPGLTVMENVALSVVLDGRRVTNQEVEAALQEVGMSERKTHRAAQLSGGEQQRVAIARALLTHPPLILADEPTASLDSENGKTVLGLLRKAASNGQGIVMVTHDQRAAAFADRVISMRDGAVIDGELQDRPLSLAVGEERR